MYHRRNCPGGLGGLDAEMFTRAVQALRAFYDEAARSGEATLHSLG